MDKALQIKRIIQLAIEAHQKSNDFDSAGIEFSWLGDLPFKIMGSVFDLLGFPDDTARFYDYNKDIMNAKDKSLIDGFYSREYLDSYIYDAIGIAGKSADVIYDELVDILEKSQKEDFDIEPYYTNR